MSTRDGHVSRVWDHAHWIPGKILTHFYVRHVPLTHLEPKLEICTYLEQLLERLCDFISFLSFQLEKKQDHFCIPK